MGDRYVFSSDVALELEGLLLERYGASLSEVCLREVADRQEHVLPQVPTPPPHLRRALVEHHLDLGCALLRLDPVNVNQNLGRCFVTTVSHDHTWRSFFYSLTMILSASTAVVVIDAAIGSRRRWYAPLFSDR